MSGNELPGNPFIDEAARSDYDTVDGIGNAYATLALAYEQRTANLIAALGQVGPQDAIARQIEERLNLA